MISILKVLIIHKDKGPNFRTQHVPKILAPGAVVAGFTPPSLKFGLA